MNRRDFGLMMALVALAAAGTAESQDLDLSRCREIQPTLHDYYVEQYSQSYLDGNILLSPIEDSEANEKLRRDMSVHHCRWAAGREVEEDRSLQRSTETDALGMAGMRLAGNRILRKGSSPAWTATSGAVRRSEFPDDACRIEPGPPTPKA